MRRLTSGFPVVLGFLCAVTVVGCNGGSSSASTNPPAVTITLSTPNGATEVGKGESVTITANVLHDDSNKGVTWSMTGTGTLSNHTPTSVMYTAPVSVSTATSDTITATSVTQPAVTARITITINPDSLTVETTSLGAGTVGLPYTTTLYAHGGSPSYNWSVSSGSLPSWASLNTSTGLLSGTPDAAGTATFTVQVTDSETPPATGHQALTLTVAQPDSANNAALKGQYAFRLQGFDDATGNQFAMVGSFNADGNGHITSGIEDINGPGGYQPEVSFTGTYTIGTDNRGIAKFTDSSNSAVTLTIAVGALNGSNVATRGSLIEFDDADGTTGKRGSGFLFLQNPNTFSLAHITGPYAFLFAGQTQQTGTRLALAGAYTADGNGNVTNGQADTNTNGVVSAQTFTGTIAATANTTSIGRVIDTPAGIPLHFVYYIVSDERTLAMSTDPEATSGLVAGEVLAQRSTPYSAASLNGASVGYGVGKSIVNMGLWTFNGSGTAMYSVVWSNADYSSISIEPQTGSLSYVPEANGRVTTAGGSLAPGVPGAPILYLVDASKGFLMSTDDSVSAGFFEPQTGGPFSNESLSGNYFFGTVTPADTNAGTASGAGTSTVSGTLNLTVDWSYPVHLLGTSRDAWLYVTIGPDGFGEPQDPFFVSDSPLYVISPGKFVVMEVDVPYPYPGPMITIFQH